MPGLPGGNSPKRMPLDERLEKELGIKVTISVIFCWFALVNIKLILFCATFYGFWSLNLEENVVNR